MRRVLSWIAIVITGVSVGTLLLSWGLKDDGVLQLMASIGGSAVGIFVAMLVAWFLMPIWKVGDEA